jgi:hypothetical protein
LTSPIGASACRQGTCKLAKSRRKKNAKAE